MIALSSGELFEFCGDYPLPGRDHSRRTVLLSAALTAGFSSAATSESGQGAGADEPPPLNPDQPPAIENLRQGVFIKRLDPDPFFRSNTVDFIQVASTVTPGVRIAAAIYKPAAPGPVLLKSHGWHGSVTRPSPETANPNPGYLTVELDMRGRSYSTGQPDANGLELYDFYDALTHVRAAYADYISNPDRVHFQGGSGGGGNALAIAAKFPDLFASIVASYPISDYAAWYSQDAVGEFRDEMDVWIGRSPSAAPEAYAARSGLTGVPNILSPLALIHGETDVRVPASHSRRFVQAMQLMGKPVTYLELPGVGTRDHLGNITAALRDQADRLTTETLAAHSVAPTLPRRGFLIVPGFVRTKAFAIFMASVDDLGLAAYDIDAGVALLIKGAGRVAWS